MKGAKEEEIRISKLSVILRRGKSSSFASLQFKRLEKNG